jgi:hypothetical protein
MHSALFWCVEIEINKLNLVASRLSKLAHARCVWFFGMSKCDKVVGEAEWCKYKLKYCNNLGYRRTLFRN